MLQRFHKIFSPLMKTNWGNLNSPSVLISTQCVQKYAYWNGGSVSNEIFYAFKHRISTA